MPYSKKLNTLFIHIPKNAGKSVETALCVVSEQEQEGYSWRSPLNCLGKWLLEATSDKKAKQRLFGVVDKSFAAQHMTLQEIELLNLVDKEILDSAFKFAVVRNPWDRALSTFNHMGRNGKSFSHQNFYDFLKDYYTSPSVRHNDFAHKRTQVEYIRNTKGGIGDVELIRFESLEDDFGKLTKRMKWPNSPMPHIGKQRDRTSYRDYYTDITALLVSEIFREDIETLGYKF